MAMILTVIAATLVFLVVWHLKGPATATFLAILAACTLTTVDLFSLGSSSVLTAMAPSTPTFATFSLALLGGILALPRLTFKNIPLWLLLFLFALVVITAFRGSASEHMWSGVVQWASVVAAWGLGGAVSQSSRRDGLPGDRLIALAIGGVIGWQAIISVLQLVGFRAVSSIAVGDLDITRASGLAGHSGNLGKILFFLIVLLLPISRSQDRVARRWAVVGISVGALLTGLTYSRANSIAVVLAIGLWLILSPGMALGKRLFIPLLGLIVALPILDVLVLRNAYDPDGGSRPSLLATGLRQISETLWLGVGPNNYLNYVGQYDAFAAGGLPVHSAFLLALAELGLICSLLLIIPLVQAFVRALGFLRGGGVTRLYAVALIAATPGIVLVGATGWGLLREQYLVLMFFTIGYLVGAQTWVGHEETASLEKRRSTRGSDGLLLKERT